MITSIKWKQHNVLGNLELDLTKDGIPYNTIVIAGENGTGKTTILDTLATFLDSGPITPFDYIMYDINPFTFRIFYDSDPNNAHRLGFHRRHNINSGEVININRNKNNNYEQMKNDYFDIRTYGVIYSRARSGFKTNPVKSTTTSQLDNDKSSIDNEEDFTKIKQLIIDISSQDNAALSDLADKNHGLSQIDYELHKKNSKMFRFKKAFNNFFDNIQFDKVDEQNLEEKRILFKKFDKEIPIDSLSTGEKQIVFRGSYLLKNQKILTGGIVLIDEPELSMHPHWQEKVLEYYRDLFTVDGKQTVQMIVATHSEYVIKSALEDKRNCLVISLKNDNGIISGERVDAPKVLPTITLAETNYYTFNILSIDYHIQLYGHIQYVTGCDTISSCDKYIENHISSNNKDEKTFIKPSSWIDKKGNRINYQTLSTYIRNAIDHPDNGNKYTENELKASIELMIEIINSLKMNNIV